MSLDSEEDSKVKLPEIISNPYCENAPIITGFTLKSDDISGELTVEDLVSFDIDDMTFTIHK